MANFGRENYYKQDHGAYNSNGGMPVLVLEEILKSCKEAEEREAAEKRRRIAERSLRVCSSTIGLSIYLTPKYYSINREIPRPLPMYYREEYRPDFQDFNKINNMDTLAADAEVGVINDPSTAKSCADSNSGEDKTASTNGKRGENNTASTNSKIGESMAPSADSNRGGTTAPSTDSNSAATTAPSNNAVELTPSNVSTSSTASTASTTPPSPSPSPQGQLCIYCIGFRPVSVSPNHELELLSNGEEFIDSSSEYNNE